MPSWGKIFLGTTIGAGIAGAVAYAMRLKRMGTQLESVASAKIHSIKLDGITIRIDVQMKNPTASSVKLKFPFVKILFKDKVIGSSKVINKDITIPAYGEAKIEGVMITMPLTGLASLGGGLYNLLVKKQPAPILVKTITTIDLGWKKFPYEKIDDNTLKPKTA
jgi:hypothetical protein